MVKWILTLTDCNGVPSSNPASSIAPFFLLMNVGNLHVVPPVSTRFWKELEIPKESSQSKKKKKDGGLTMLIHANLLTFIRGVSLKFKGFLITKILYTPYYVYKRIYRYKKKSPVYKMCTGNCLQKLKMQLSIIEYFKGICIAIDTKMTPFD